MKIRVKRLLKFLPDAIKNEDNQPIMKSRETIEDDSF